MATSTTIIERRQRILEAIATWGGRGPTTGELLVNLAPVLRVTTRQIARELKTLVEEGQVEKDRDCWRVLDLDEFDRLSSEYAACLVTKMAATTLDYALPSDVQKQIRRFVTRSVARLSSAFLNHPARRWQEALKIIPASSHLDIPFVNPDVRDGVEQAILERRQVILKYSPEVSYRASISHLLLRLPNSATILAWEPGSDHPLPIRHHLVELEGIELLDEAASWPMDFNIEAYIDEFGRRSPDSSAGWQIELRVDPLLVHHWTRRMAGKSMIVGDLDKSTGRIHVTVSEEPNQDFIEWLWSYSELLEVCSPPYLREYFVRRTRDAAQPYAMDPDTVCEQSSGEALTMDLPQSPGSLAREFAI